MYASEGLPARRHRPVRAALGAFDGTFLGSFAELQAFRSGRRAVSGVQPEPRVRARAVTPDGRFLFTATEDALFQDGPSGHPLRRQPRAESSALRPAFRPARPPVRLPHRSRRRAPVPETAFSVNGVVELLPLDDDTLIAMERSFSVGAPGTGQHDQALRRRSSATDVRATARADASGDKTLLLDLDDARHPARQRRGHDVRPAAARRPPVARAGQRQQLRRHPVHPVPAVRDLRSMPAGGVPGRPSRYGPRRQWEIVRVISIGLWPFSTILARSSWRARGGALDLCSPSSNLRGHPPCTALSPAAKRSR